MKVLALCGSLTRSNSLNQRLLQLAVERVRSHDVKVTPCELADFPMPLYCDDDRKESGFPAGAEALKRALEAADGLLLASPEHNYSIPGPLKNAIDWTSRYRPVPWHGRHALLLSASPSRAGGVRGLWQLRAPLTGMGVHVFPEVFALAGANRAFTADGELEDAELSRRLDQLVDSFLNLLRRVAS